jgi:tRNA (cmo5U34)-methyltransferase
LENFLRDNGLRLIGKPDRIFAGLTYPRPFEFNKDVVEVFDDMVSRSVPLYRDVIDSILYWVAEHYQDGTAIYDLGCSTGTTIAAIAKAMPFSVNVQAVDNSQDMLDKAREKLASETRHSIEYRCENLQDVRIDNASLVIMNYTLQFVPVKDRLKLLTKIRDGLCPGGVLILSEKVRSENPIIQETATRIYEDFKCRQGYSRDEISRKKEALDNVLVPLSEKQQIEMLTQSGFQNCEIAMKWNNFTTFIAM